MIIAAITFNEDLTVYPNFRENIPLFSLFINLEIETIFQFRMGYGIEKSKLGSVTISWIFGKQPFTSRHWSITFFIFPELFRQLEVFLLSPPPLKENSLVRFDIRSPEETVSL